MAPDLMKMAKNIAGLKSEDAKRQQAHLLLQSLAKLLRGGR